MELLTALVLPSGISYLFFASGLLTRWIPKLRRFSWPLLAGGALLTLVFSSGFTATVLSSPIEYQWPSVQDARSHPETKRIVVLTGWAADDPGLALSDRMNASSAFRVLMTLELHRQRPELPIIVSGSAVTARVMADVLIATGVPAAQVSLEDQSTFTAQSAELLKPMVGDAPFLLVTSAGHLRRAMGTMEHYGLKPVAVPTDHRNARDWSHADATPKPESLVTSDLAMHEYLGVLWYRLRNRV